MHRGRGRGTETGADKERGRENCRELSGTAYALIDWEKEKRKKVIESERVRVPVILVLPRWCRPSFACTFALLCVHWLRLTHKQTKTLQHHWLISEERQPAALLTVQSSTHLYRQFPLPPSNFDLHCELLVFFLFLSLSFSPRIFTVSIVSALR